MTAKDWIPLAERKPEKEGDYLAFSHNFGEHICAWRGGRFDSFPHALIASLVTHWMPLPPPPEPPDPFDIWWNSLEGGPNEFKYIGSFGYVRDAAKIVWDAAVNATKLRPTGDIPGTPESAICPTCGAMLRGDNATKKT